MRPLIHAGHRGAPPRRNYAHKLRAFLPVCSEKWISKVVISLVFAVLLIILLFIFQPFQTEIHVLVINTRDPPLYVTDKEFLSVALDSSLIAEGFQGFNMTDIRILKLMKPLGGGYLRVGGTMADRLIFHPNGHQAFKTYFNGLQDGDVCAYEDQFCKELDRPNFTMSGAEWKQLNNLAIKTGLTILFDLNCLQRHPDGSWNPKNAESLISFSNRQGYKLIWELGNEPNAFKHVFNYPVNASQLAKDFLVLRELLDKYPNSRNSLLVGPDTTKPRPHNKATTEYLYEFLKNCQNSINAITWHQYYFNSRDAYLYYFINPDVFNLLQKEINKIKSVIKLAGVDKKVWLGETSSSYGGGARSFSDRFISTFIWMDKLGLAAKNGLSVVVRQSLFKGYYALINENYEPNPDWWLTILYKQLVGNKVVECFSATPPEVRLYCHCSAKNDYIKSTSITVYGVNMKNSEASIRIQEAESNKSEAYNILGFILQTHISVLSRYIFLNDVLLYMTDGEMPDFIPTNTTTNTIVLPPFSLGFWIIPSSNFVVCN